MGDGRKVQIRLSKSEQRQLDDLLSGGLQPVRTVLRALVLRQLADGQAIRTVARNVGLTPKTLDWAQLDGADFEPKQLPPLEEIAQARGLEWMTYWRNPGPLAQLRKQFQEAGYREQERAITYVLNRHDADPPQLWSSMKATYNWALGKHFDKEELIPIDKFVEGAFKWVAFDLTCRYGFRPGRALRIVVVLWLFFSVVLCLIHALAGEVGYLFRRETSMAR